MVPKALVLRSLLLQVYLEYTVYRLANVVRAVKTSLVE